MSLEFNKLNAECIEELAKYYGKRHDQTCDSVILDNFLWRIYYDVRYCVRDRKAVLWTMNIRGKQYAALPVCAMEDMPYYFSELEQYFNKELGIPLEIYLADEPAVDYLNLPKERYSVQRGGIKGPAGEKTGEKEKSYELL